MNWCTVTCVFGIHFVGNAETSLRSHARCVVKKENVVQESCSPKLSTFKVACAWNTAYVIYLHQTVLCVVIWFFVFSSKQIDHKCSLSNSKIYSYLFCFILHFHIFCNVFNTFNSISHFW